MDWGALISAGLGAGGSLLGGDGGDKYMSLKDRWGKHLVGDIKDLQQDYLDLDPLEYYPYQTFANLNPFQQNAYLGMAGYGNDWQTGGIVEDAQLGAGLAGTDALLGGSSYLDSLLSGTSPSFDEGGIFDQVFNNPYLEDMVDASTRDINRELDWGALPGLNSDASLSGNMASSRAGVSEGIMRGMADDRIADVTADIYGNAFDSAVDAAMANDQTALQGAYNMGQSGLYGLSDAYSSGSDNLQLLLGGGAGFQDQLQKWIDEDMARWDYNQASPWQYYSDQQDLLAGTLPSGGQLGDNASWMDTALTGAQFGAGLYDAFQGIGGPSSASVPLNIDTYFDGGGWDSFLSPTGGTAAGFGVIG